MSNNENQTKKGTLYIVSIPIGNDDDITLRALKVLRKSDVIVCEEPKTGIRTLKIYKLSQKMELLNEQNEVIKTPELINMIENGLTISLISDCGTPVFADPGAMLVKSALEHDINIAVVPGASSIMTAIVRSGFDITSFLYAGFLSREKSERFIQLQRLKDEPRTVVLLETPYRIMPLLEAAYQIMPNRKAYIGCNLTMHFETHHYGTFSELYEQFSSTRFKGEFVVCIEGADYNELDNAIEKPVKKIILKDRSSQGYSGKDKNRRGERFENREKKSFGRGRNDRKSTKKWSDSKDDSRSSRRKPFDNQSDKKRTGDGSYNREHGSKSRFSRKSTTDTKQRGRTKFKKN